MSEYRATFATTINLIVRVDASDEDEAADLAWELAEEYLTTVTGDMRSVFADVTLDGVGADVVEAVSGRG